MLGVPGNASAHFLGYSPVDSGELRCHMTCPICGQESLAPGTTTFATDAAGTVVVVRDVPAQVCGNCGEAFISDNVAAELEVQVFDCAGQTDPSRSSTSPHRSIMRSAMPSTLAA